MDIQVSQIIFQIINFSVILFLFKKYVYKPVLKVLDNRSERIKEGLEAAEKNLKIQSELEDKQAKILEDAKKQAQIILSDAQKQASEIIKTAQVKAKVEAKKIITREKESFQSIIDKQTQDFEHQAAATVVKATEAVVRDLLTQKVQLEIVESQIKNLKLS